MLEWSGGKRIELFVESTSREESRGRGSYIEYWNIGSVGVCVFFKLKFPFENLKIHRLARIVTQKKSCRKSAENQKENENKSNKKDIYNNI